MYIDEGTQLGKECEIVTSLLCSFRKATRRTQMLLQANALTHTYMCIVNGCINLYIYVGISAIIRIICFPLLYLLARFEVY